MTIGTKLSAKYNLAILKKIRCFTFFHSIQDTLSSQSFQDIAHAGVSSKSWIATNMSKSFTQAFASSVVSIDPFAVITLVEYHDTSTVSNSSGVSDILLTRCMDAPETTINSLSSGLTVEVGATLHSILGFVLQVRSANFVQRLGRSPSCICCTIFCPKLCGRHAPWIVVERARNSAACVSAACVFQARGWNLCVGSCFQDR